MSQKISVSKDWSGAIEFDTYIPTESESANIQDALKLFFFGTDVDGNSYDNTDSIYKHLITLKNIAEPVAAALTAHTAATTGVHGVGAGAVVGTTTSQVLTNKTIQQPLINNPQINENIILQATSTELNILDGATVTTAELNKLSGTTVTTTELNRLSGVTSAVQTQINNIIANLIPQGTINPYAGDTAPSGWLLCAGQTLNATANPEYATLFSVIGTRYGGTGISSFRVPDLRGRTIAGLDNMGGTDAGRLTWQNVLGTVGASSTTVDDGEQRVILTQAQLPDFKHEYQVSRGGGVTGTYFYIIDGTYGGSYFYGHGSGQSHNNMQPTMLLNYIIKF